ncbi:MAG: alginate O-acetyltransferase complex protein AlgI [Planctomycetota bacterium]|jgi:alginate O-acetyltransferase complex protein AlgI
MIFSEPRFLLFFALVFGVHWMLRGNTPRKAWLLAASLFFYGSWDFRFLALILGCAAVDYICAGRIKKAQLRGSTGKAWLITSLCYDLGTLAFFKYFNFFADSGAEFMQWLGLPASEVTLQIVLPVGISFFTFQAMSYTIDVYRKKLEPAPHFFDFALFVTFFPQLVAGPIVRASEFLPQLKKKRTFRDVDTQLAFGQFLSGFIKKAVIADMMAGPADAVFAAPAEFTALSIAIGVVCYAIQIYCDFSGYSDMAIGAARLLGYDLTRNFKFPYLAASITDFWRRWHISLSGWLRDYLYISLGGNRGSRLFTHRNLALTMLLGGLWHGAGWNFVVWGAIHGIALVIHKEWLGYVGEGRLPILSRLLTLYTVLLAWIYFRASTFTDAWTMTRAWVLWDSPGTKTVQLWSPDPSWDAGYRLLLLVAPLLVLHIMTSCNLHIFLRRLLPAWLITLLLGMLAAIALAFMPLEARPFIYFQF